ncbi:hypothetical protein [Halopelagius fulvigenes]|uniref:Glycosyltransferase n=1 Tax=Halopelagius fulvigenes TaxID=1198324 RepID=A0ABD5TWL9_9EURY
MPRLGRLLNEANFDEVVQVVVTYAEAMAADCTLIGAAHPESAASEVIGDAGYLAEPSVESIIDKITCTLDGHRSPEDPLERATRFDWDAVAEQAETTYERAIAGK